ncbi:hypothetical protein Tco_0096846, partial [Tanacetum coccineum]
EIHVTWAHLEKKRTTLRLYTKSLKEIIIQPVETASPAIVTTSELDEDGIRIFKTTSGSSRLKRSLRSFIKATTSGILRHRKIQIQINIDDLSIEQYLRLTQENQTPSMVKKLDEEVGYTTDEESVMSEHKAIDHAHVVNTRSFEEELSSEEDLDEWLKTEMEKHITDLKKPSEAMEDIINNDRFTSNLPYQPSLEELNPGSFLLLFTIDNYNSYAMANIDASNNVMPRSIYEYLMLANLGGTISGEDCGMWPTCDPNSSFFYGYKEVFGKSKQGMLRQWVCFRDHERRTVKGSCMGFADFLQVHYGNQRIDDTTHEQRYYEWVAQNYEFDNNRTLSTTIVSDKYSYKTNHSTPIPLDEWDIRCHITYTGSTSNQNIPNNDPTPFSLAHSEFREKTNINSFDVEEEYAKEIRNPYSRRFDEYKQVFNNEVEQLSNEYTLRIGKKGYVLDDVGRNASNTIEKLSILGTTKDSKKMSYGEVEMKN